MKLKVVAALISFAFAVCAVPRTAEAGCCRRFDKLTCRSGGKILLRLCGHHHGPIEIYLNGCLITVKPEDSGKRIKLNGFGPGEYTIKAQERGSCQEEPIEERVVCQ